MKRETVTRHGRTFNVVTLNPGSAPRRKRPAGVRFVKVPTTWIEKLAGQEASVYAVMLQLLYLNFKSYKRSFKLTNMAMERLKVNRWAKGRALRKLEQLGLISVEQKPGKAPVVTILKP